MKHISLLIIFCLSAFTIQAQKKDTTVNKSITITRKYQPDIHHSNKVVSIPKMRKVTINKPAPQYLNISTSMPVSYHIQTLQAEQLQFKQKKHYQGFARIGFGTPLNTLADLIAPIYNSEKNKMNITLSHLGAFHDKKQSNTNLNFDYNHLFKKFKLYSTIGLEHDFFNYYGDIFNNDLIIKDINQYQWWQLSDIDNHFRIHPQIGIRSLSLTETLTLDAGLSYKMFHSYTNKLTEHQSQIKGLLKKQLNNNQLGLNLDAFHFIYNSNENDFNTQNNDYLNYSIIKLNPYYKIEHKNWFLRLGVKTVFSISAGKPFAPAPDIAFKWNVIPQYVSLAGAVTGDVIINSLDKTYKENRYLSPQNRLADTYTPIDSYLGATISPINNLIIDVYGEYQLISNPYFYVNKHYTRSGDDFFHNRFDVVGENSAVQKTAIGVNLAWNYLDKVSIYTKTKYNRWFLNQQKHAWHLPKWEAKLGTNIKVRDNIEINSQFDFQEGRYVLLSNANGIKMKPIFDWNISSTYSYSRRLSFFLKANNILNQKYQLFNGYDVEGFSAIIGTAFYF